MNVGSFVLINDGKTYGGKYVATKSFTDKEVVASGDTPVAVRDKAASLGFSSPVIFFIPQAGTVSVY
jgi:hypothetical protein